MTDINFFFFGVKRAGRHFGFLKRAGRHQKGAGRRALEKRPRGSIDCAARIGVNISERKSGTERTKKRKKQELVFSHRQGRNWYFSTPSRRYTDFAKSYDNLGYLYPGALRGPD